MMLKKLKMFILLICFLLLNNYSTSYSKRISVKDVYNIVQNCKYNKFSFSTEVYFAIIYIESNFKAEIIGPKGEIGLMQLSPMLLKHYKVPVKSAIKPKINICLGIRYLEELYEICNNKKGKKCDKLEVIGRYNMGNKYNKDSTYIKRFLVKYFEFKEEKRGVYK